MSDGSKGTMAEKANTKKSEPAAEKPKSKLTWKERLERMPPEEAAEARAKAAEASRRSKAKKRGTSPEQAAVARLEARLAKNTEKTNALTAERATLTAEFEQAKAALAATEKEASDAN